jgi:predicted nicotinamide N-methyase
MRRILRQRLAAPFPSAYKTHQANKFPDLAPGGVGLAGIAAWLCGASPVVLTDIEEDDEVLENLRENCRGNGANCTVAGLSWGFVTPQTAELVRAEPR